MIRVRPATLAAVGLAAVSAAAVSACGSQSIDVASNQPAMKRGAVLFQERCSGCHTLSAAASNGSASNVAKAQKFNGPNFNQRKETAERALYAIQNGGFSGAIMPQNIVTGEDAKIVAEFVAKYSGKDVNTPVSPSNSGGMGAGGSTKPAPAPKQDLAAIGASVFSQNGCGACHQLSGVAGANGKVGPSLNGVGGDPAAKIKLSIVNPNAEVEKGYSKGIMPQNFGQTLSSEQINGLVAYLQKVAR